MACGRETAYQTLEEMLVANYEHEKSFCTREVDFDEWGIPL